MLLFLCNIFVDRFDFLSDFYVLNLNFSSLSRLSDAFFLFWTYGKNRVGDPLQDLLSKYTKNVRSRCNSSALSHDEESLQLLIVNENFRAALELTEKILSGFNQGRGMAGHLSKHTVQSIRIWHARFILLNKVHNIQIETPCSSQLIFIIKCSQRKIVAVILVLLVF